MRKSLVKPSRRRALSACPPVSMASLFSGSVPVSPTVTG